MLHSIVNAFPDPTPYSYPNFFRPLLRYVIKKWSLKSGNRARTNPPSSSNILSVLSDDRNSQKTKNSEKKFLGLLKSGNQF